MSLISENDISNMADKEWTFLDVCNFGFPVIDFTSNKTEDNRIKHDNRMLQWIECDRCKTILEFPKQPHFCDGGIVTTLNMQLLDYYPECVHCYCVLSHPCQPHRCPVLSRDINNDSDWTLCDDISDVIEYSHQVNNCDVKDDVIEYCNEERDCDLEELRHVQSRGLINISDWIMCEYCSNCNDVIDNSLQDHNCDVIEDNDNSMTNNESSISQSANHLDKTIRQRL
ncbi:hypothetical protein ACF0H5_022358 [Mactra antiquata]